jgi:hypothetical protein
MDLENRLSVDVAEETEPFVISFDKEAIPPEDPEKMEAALMYLRAQGRKLAFELWSALPEHTMNEMIIELFRLGGSKKAIQKVMMSHEIKPGVGGRP